MNSTDTFFYTWLTQLQQMAKINDEIQTLKDDVENLQDNWSEKSEENSPEQLNETIKEKQAELQKIKDAADFNKKQLINIVRGAKDLSVIINPKESTDGLSHNSYHLYLKENDDLEYVTM